MQRSETERKSYVMNNLRPLSLQTEEAMLQVFRNPAFCVEAEKILDSTLDMEAKKRQMYQALRRAEAGKSLPPPVSDAVATPRQEPVFVESARTEEGRAKYVLDGILALGFGNRDLAEQLVLDRDFCRNMEKIMDSEMEQGWKISRMCETMMLAIKVKRQTEACQSIKSRVDEVNARNNQASPQNPGENSNIGKALKKLEADSSAEKSRTLEEMETEQKRLLTMAVNLGVPVNEIVSVVEQDNGLNKDFLNYLRMILRFSDMPTNRKKQAIMRAIYVQKKSVAEEKPVRQMPEEWLWAFKLALELGCEGKKVFRIVASIRKTERFVQATRSLLMAKDISAEEQEKRLIAMVDEIGKRQRPKTGNYATLKRVKILAALYDSQSGFLSLEEIQGKAGFSRSGLGDAMKFGKEKGYVVEKNSGEENGEKNSSNKKFWEISEKGKEFVNNYAVRFLRCELISSSISHRKNRTFHLCLLPLLERAGAIEEQLKELGWYPRKIPELFRFFDLDTIQEKIEEVTNNPKIENPGAYLFGIFFKAGKEERIHGLASTILSGLPADVREMYQKTAMEMEPEEFCHLACALRKRNANLKEGEVLQQCDVNGIANYIEKRSRARKFYQSMADGTNVLASVAEDVCGKKQARPERKMSAAEPKVQADREIADEIKIPSEMRIAPSQETQRMPEQEVPEIQELAEEEAMEIQAWSELKEENMDIQPEPEFYMLTEEEIQAWSELKEEENRKIQELPEPEYPEVLTEEERKALDKIFPGAEIAVTQTAKSSVSAIDVMRQIQPAPEHDAAPAIEKIQKVPEIKEATEPDAAPISQEIRKMPEIKEAKQEKNIAANPVETEKEKLLWTLMPLAVFLILWQEALKNPENLDIPDDDPDKEFQPKKPGIFHALALKYRAFMFGCPGKSETKIALKQNRIICCSAISTS